VFFWHVPAPNEALLISGSKRRLQDTLFRIVFKVGDDSVSIANAARRFLSEQDRMEVLVGRVFAGHLRSIVGGLTVEQIIRERDRVAQEVKDGSHAEMEKLGIVVDALEIQEIQEIEDGSGYINNLAAPHAASVASLARMAQAKADQEAAEREQREREAAALKAGYERDLEIKRAGFLAETQQAKAEAGQAGPRAEARASQGIAEQTALAQRHVELAAQRLEAEVRRPADAEAYRKRALAEAERDQAKFAAEGEAYRRTTLAAAEAEAAKIQADAAAYAQRVRAEAEAGANVARASSLAGGNQELIAASRIIEALPALVDAAARGIAASNLTIFNGTEGVSQVIAGVVGQGLSILHTLKKSTAAAQRDGSAAALSTETGASGDRSAATPVAPGGDSAGQTRQ
jgi:flotillin